MAYIEFSFEYIAVDGRAELNAQHEGVPPYGKMLNGIEDVHVRPKWCIMELCIWRAAYEFCVNISDRNGTYEINFRQNARGSSQAM